MISNTVRKFDMRLLPALGAPYAFALVDRVNLGNVSTVQAIEWLLDH